MKISIRSNKDSAYNRDVPKNRRQLRREFDLYGHALPKKDGLPNDVHFTLHLSPEERNLRNVLEVLDKISMLFARVLNSTFHKPSVETCLQAAILLRVKISDVILHQNSASSWLVIDVPYTAVTPEAVFASIKEKLESRSGEEWLDIKFAIAKFKSLCGLSLSKEDKKVIAACNYIFNFYEDEFISLSRLYEYVSHERIEAEIARTGNPSVSEKERTLDLGSVPFVHNFRRGVILAANLRLSALLAESSVNIFVNRETVELRLIYTSSKDLDIQLRLISEAINTLSNSFELMHFFVRQPS